MKGMKKWIAAFLVVVLAIGSFAGCAKKASDGVVEIEWMFWDDLTVTTDNTSLGYAETIKRFNEQYEGKYKVVTTTTNLEEYDTKLNARIASNDCPDVYICNPGPNLTQYVEGGHAADLTDILKKDNLDWYDSFADGIFERLTYDGKIYAVPANFTAALVFYNTEIFDAVGVTPPTTFDEWLDVCAKIEAAGYAPIACSAGTAWCLSMIAGYLCDRAGGPDNLAGIPDNTTSWMDPSFITAGEKLVEISQYFQETAAGDSNDQATALFYEGQAGMLVQGSWVIGQINGAIEGFEDKCGVFSFPAIEGGSDPNRMIVKTDNMVMSATTEHQEACIALLKMFTDETAQKYTAEVGGKIPVVDVEFDESVAPAQLGYVMDILSKSTGTFGFYNESLDSVEAGDTFDNAMVDLFLGAITPEQAFQRVEDFYAENVWTE